MDPLSTIEELQDAVEDKEYGAAVMHLATYYQWRLNGGFEPRKNGTPCDKLAAELAIKLAERIDSEEV